ncbi:MAG TPA: hypothetical protein VL974_14430 [Magnetospirillum sp.]|jgi:hypothetical protein|nr:hypothetical protein [Magnetospirillum sp.]
MAGDGADQLGPVLERLESLAAALEALDGGAGSPAATAVLDTLSRMETRDQQTLSAVDTFATALKSLSHHLAHLRQSVHTANGEHAAKLDELASRLVEIEGRMGPGLLDGLEFDLSPLAEALDAIGDRLSGLETKLAGLGNSPSHWPFDSETFVNALSGIADRLVRVEAKVDSIAQQPALEPESTNSLLAAIARRVEVMEGKVDSGVDGSSIAACLLAVDRRLSRIETGLGMDRPLPAVEDIPDLVPDPTDRVEPAGDTVAPAEAKATPEPAFPTESPFEDMPPFTPPPLPDPNTMPRERVDQLLEQVFRVLAR